MAQSFLHYELQDGYIHNWLVAGPLITSIGARETVRGCAQEIAASDGLRESITAAPPVEHGQVAFRGPEGASTELTWDYRCVGDDHLLDLAADDALPGHLLRSWAYAELLSPSVRSVRLVLYSFGPARVWLNGRPVLQQEERVAHLPHGLEGEANLAEGPNTVVVLLEQTGGESAPCAVALGVLEAEDEVTVRLGTLPKKVSKHQSIERLAQKAYIERDLYAGEQKLYVKWPGGVRSQRELMVRVEKPSGHIIGYVEREIKGSVSFSLLEATAAKDGLYRVRICPEYNEYIRGMSFSRDLDVNLLHSAYVGAPQESYEQRVEELLQHALWWTDGLYTEIARMALGWWRDLQQGPIRQAVELVQARGEGCHEALLGLLLIVYRYARHESFPQALAGPLEECILGHDYEWDGVGGCANPLLAEDLAVQRYVCETLAGQLYAERTFAHSGQPGGWHRERGEALTMEWLSRCAHGGLAAWNSGEALQGALLATVLAVDFSTSETLGALAAAVTDKLLFALAAGSLKGMLGSTHGSTRAPSVTDSRMEPTSSISRLLWGMGCWNQHLAAAVALAVSEQYEVPEVLEAIAADRPEELWIRERQVSAWSGTGVAAVPGQEVNTVTYKTPDTMLSSAQNYRPGEPGRDEHIWQATLSPEAVIFVNHPGCVNQRAQYRPNFWCGNRVLPRVAQWKDLLVALYCLPDDDWLGYTHAHFPTAAFDEYAFRGGWAFARVGEGYLAITASQGFTLVKNGPGAYRELRSIGKRNVWLCQMGRAAQDGSFADFRQKVVALPATFDGAHVSCTSLRGDAISYGWEEPWIVNGAIQPTEGFPHYESPYCLCALGAPEMEIVAGEWMLRLNFDLSVL